MTPTPETHVFLGMFRPADVPQAMPCKTCQMNAGIGSIFTLNKSRDCWLAGHFDTPVYATREEIIDRIARGACHA